jgi:hypothetical protein
VPEYFCQHVAAALVHPRLELVPYLDHPLRSEPELPAAQPGDAVLVMDYFGLRGPCRHPERTGVDIVEDHSHDLSSDWAVGSTADFCVASLRKTLPLPDGGALWSPRGHRLPRMPRSTAQRRRAAAGKLEAMMLKALYLAGGPVDKDRYRALALRAEGELGRPGVAPISDVARAVALGFPLARWRRRRAANHAVLRERLTELGWARVLDPYPGGGVPFNAALLFESPALRDQVRRRLIEARVYPAVLWPLEETLIPVRREVKELSRRILCIHCDGRYGADDMARVADLIVAAGRPGAGMHR